jgi:hypothetical protein
MMKSSMRGLWAGCAVGAALLASPVAVHAVDGVALIDQAKALAGNVTPGDAAGFPVTISRPGSYRLSSNLTVPAGVNAVHITASGVTLDLNGFTIVGPKVFPGALGIIGDNQTDVRIGNGSVVGFTIAMQFKGAAERITLQDLTLDSTTMSGTTPVGGLGAIVGETKQARAILRGITSNGQIQVTCPSVVLHTVSFFGVVELNVPPDGSGFAFPRNCRGEHVF